MVDRIQKHERNHATRIVYRMTRWWIVWWWWLRERANQQMEPTDYVRDSWLAGKHVGIILNWAYTQPGRAMCSERQLFTTCPREKWTLNCSATWRSDSITILKKTCHFREGSWSFPISRVYCIIAHAMPRALYRLTHISARKSIELLAYVIRYPHDVHIRICVSHIYISYRVHKNRGRLL